MQIDDAGVPEWAKWLGTLVLGAGGARWLAVVLENRRLGKKEYRETLMGLIEKLQDEVSTLQYRVGSLEEELSNEREIVVRLRGELQDCQEALDADPAPDDGS